MSTDTFISKCLRGETLANEIDQFVEAWHSSDVDTTLQNYLGMTAEEYNAWVLDASVLPFILKARRFGQPLDEVLQHDVERIAARNGSHSDVLRLLHWLEEHAG